MKRPTKTKKPQTKKPKPKASAISFKQPPSGGKRSILNTPMYR